MIAIEGKTDYWAWLEHIERKWKTGAYTGEGQWRYRRTEPSLADEPARRLRGQPANTNQPPHPTKFKILADIATRNDRY